MRILMVCVYDWAGAAQTLAQVVNEHTDHIARVVAFKSTYMGYTCDALAPSDVEFWSLLEWADVLNVYDNAQALLPNEVLGKPIIKFYLGSEYRHNHEHFNRLDTERDWTQLCSSLDLSLYGPTWLPFPMGVAYRPKPDDEPFVVCHAPTNRKKKGTALVIEALDGLDGVRLDILEHLPHSQCMERKAEAHVLIDQVGEHAMVGIGCNALEAWVYNMPVISDAPDDVCRMIEEHCGRLPFYRASTAEQIRSAVNQLRANPSFFTEWAERGYMFLRRWHDPLTVANQFVEICQGVLVDEAHPAS